MDNGTTGSIGFLYDTHIYHISTLEINVIIVISLMYARQGVSDGLCRDENGYDNERAVVSRTIFKFHNGV